MTARNTGFAFLFSLLFLISSHGDSPVTPLKPDENITLYPAIASWDRAKAKWNAQIHGIIYEPNTGKSESWTLDRLRTLLGLPKNMTRRQESTFSYRAQPFIVDHERGKKIVIALTDKRYSLPESTPNGHFQGSILFTAAKGVAELPFHVVVPNHSSRSYGGQIALIPPGGIGVISDIDDTIKQSNVLDHKKLIANTFIHPFKPVDGMSAVYRNWAGSANYFHYVTSSPWQLYTPLWRFIQAEKFPAHGITMRHLRLADKSLLRFFADPKAYKTEAISAVLNRFPQKKFILVGDSGEKDAVIYADIARKHPKRILAIYIRSVRKDHSREQMKAVFEDVDLPWQVFRKPDELPMDVPQLQQ